MKRVSLVLGALAVALIVTSTGAFAASTYQVLNTQARPLFLVQVDRASFDTGPRPVGLPQTQQREDDDSTMGPASVGSDTMINRGNAIVGSRGGAVMTPRQRADRDIQRLIRQLG